MPKTPPLIDAIYQGSVETVRQLLRGNVDIECADSEGGTPLMYAAANCNEVVVNLLLKKGANVEARDKNGMSPLICAAISGNKDIVSALLENGAKVQKAPNGRSATFYAKMYNRRAVYYLLQRIEEKQAMVR